MKTHPSLSISAPDDLTESERAILSQWIAELEKLIQERREKAFRKTVPHLEIMLKTAIENARQAIVDGCARKRIELAEDFIATAGHFYARRGEALEAARQTDAARSLRDYLRGEFTADTLDGMTRQAKQVRDLLERILAGGIVWNFERPDWT